MRLTAILATALLTLFLSAPVTSGESPLAGNAVYQVAVEDGAGGDGVGGYTILTGPEHPAGDGQPVLFGGTSGQDAGSSLITVRSYTTGTDYTQSTSRPGSANLVASLDELGFTEPLGNSGYNTTYDLASAPNLPDDLTVVSTAEVTGSGVQGSAVEIKTSLSNTGDVPLLLGVRYLLDFAPSGDDGPTLELAGSGNAAGSEASLTPAPQRVTVSPSDPDPTDVRVDVTAPGRAADLLKYVSWPHAFPFSFDYTPAGRDVAGESGINDSAVLLYFGATQQAAIAVMPGETVDVLVRVSEPVAPVATPTPTPSPPPVTPPPGATPPSASPTAPGAASPADEPVIIPEELPRTGGSNARRR
jgi:hypothetical protein